MLLGATVGISGRKEKDGVIVAVQCSGESVAVRPNGAAPPPLQYWVGFYRCGTKVVNLGQNLYRTLLSLSFIMHVSMKYDVIKRAENVLVEYRDTVKTRDRSVQ